MRNGSKFWPARDLALGGLTALLILAGAPGSGAARADSLPEVTWESRWTEETADGELIEHPPFVAVNDVRLYRFAEMQSVTWRDTLTIDHDEDGIETLYVFTVWQGGASQGEQLMLLSVKPQGIAVLGPYPQDFETLQIGHTNSESAPEFRLLAGDGAVLETVFYVEGFRTK
ncbi:hypothetical protein [Hoeflea sp.]|uniref:hypothetical protein n=1 Tax=Hoeflea sp. TaxID=1940281 RepID=UPI003B5156E9